MNNIYHPEYVRNLFNRMSNSYERMNFITSFGFSIRWRRLFLGPLKKTNKKINILDLLTGMGETWNSTSKKFPNAKISALDFSDGMLKYAKNKNDTKFNSEIIILKQDVLSNKLKPDSYDIITCAFGLKTFNDEQLKILAKETSRVLKNNGSISFVEVSKPDNIVLKSLYVFYLKLIIPILGKVFLGNPTEYRMLWKYTNKFKNSKNAMKIFEQEGFNLKYDSYFFGCASGFNGVKK